jgi:hypothetical protein
MKGALTSWSDTWATSTKPSFPRADQRLIRAAFAELSDDTIEQIAQRVAAILADQHWNPSPQLVDAAELARQYGLTRDWVYQHADLLGVTRFGTGPRARLRFDPERVTAVLQRGTEQSTKRTETTPRRRSPRAPSTTPLLPIHPTQRVQR